jgi:hypothetical protein
MIPPPPDSTDEGSLTRREFLRGSATGAAALALGSSAAAASGAAGAMPAAPADRKFIGIQLDALAPAEEGMERVLDEVQRRASVNVLMPDALWFTPDTTARPTRTLAPGHVRDPNSRMRGGRMGFVHSQHYRDTGLDLRALAPADGVPDILTAMGDEARRRGLRIIPIIKDYLPESAPGHERMREEDFNGRQATTSCKNNPYYRSLLRGIMEDMIRSYNVDGIMYIAERQGAFMDTLGLRFRGMQRGLPGSRTCFCRYCREKAARRGINVERAVRGFEELAGFTAEGRARRRPVDGYFVTLWRIMLRYPELLAWEHMWHVGLREVYQMLHGTIKGVRPSVLYGMHVWPNVNMNPLLSAEHDFSELGRYHDFIKHSVYSNCGGPRMGSYIDSVSQTMYGDLPPEEVLQFHYRVMNYDEAPLSRVRQAGLKNDFVYRESKRAMAAAGGTNAMVFPGIDIDIPTDIEKRMTGVTDPAVTTRADVRRGVGQAFRAGVPGIVISRQYSEMNLDNLSGVGDALREMGIRG